MMLTMEFSIYKIIMSIKMATVDCKGQYLKEHSPDFYHGYTSISMCMKHLIKFHQEPFKKENTIACSK